MNPSDPSSRPAAPRAARAPAPPSPVRYNASDQLAKNILRDALSCAASSETEVEVLAATQKIDVYTVPDPARAAERKQIGLLGELTEEPTQVEPFRGTPNVPPIRRVMCKQLTWHHELERRAKLVARAARAAARAAGRGPEEEDADDDETDADDEAPQIVPFPWLVVISPGRPNTVIEMYGCTELRAGVYGAVPGLQMRVVVLAELPRTRETLLLRMLASGELLKEALADFAALPAEAWERSILEPLLVEFRLGQDEQATNEEDAVSAAIRMGFKEYEQKLRGEAQARALLTVLRGRGVAVPDVARERILAEKDPERLERWLERAAVATEIGQVIEEPS